MDRNHVTLPRAVARRRPGGTFDAEIHFEGDKWLVEVECVSRRAALGAAQKIVDECVVNARLAIRLRLAQRRRIS